MATPFHDIIQAESIASSITPEGKRIDTIKLRYPRMVHADFMTHRVKSRNASSSRAMPSVTLLADAPYVPTFRHNQRGMQPAEHLSTRAQAEAEALWMEAAKKCQEVCAQLSDPKGLNVHKQWTNRMLEWFGYITVVATATNWDNYLGLRDHPDAQDEIQWQAQAVERVLRGVTPKQLAYGEWHLPFVTDEAREDAVKLIKDEPGQVRDLLKGARFAFERLDYLSPLQQTLLVMSSSRSARTSYRNFDGSKMTPEKDFETFLKLGSTPIHASPFEHQATPAHKKSYLNGNFEGWDQFRKFIPNECISAR